MNMDGVLSILGRFVNFSFQISSSSYRDHIAICRGVLMLRTSKQRPRGLYVLTTDFIRALVFANFLTPFT
jgi:hypothetical protein